MAQDKRKAQEQADPLHRVKQRRALLKAIGHAIPEEDVAPGTMGLALSGGGIRSATLALGLVQALARHGRLLDFDYCSTVSGGGYLGSWLGGLFLPPSARGPGAKSQEASDLLAPELATMREQTDFALRVLRDKSCETTTAFPPSWQGLAGLHPTAHHRHHGAADHAGHPPDIRHPVRWLREHSRYLAPNGASDYLAAAATMTRNWLAMLYVFVVPVALLALALVAVAWEARGMTGPLSLAWAGVAVVSFGGLATVLAYWFTEPLSQGDRPVVKGLVRWPTALVGSGQSARFASSLVGWATSIEVVLMAWLHRADLWQGADPPSGPLAMILGALAWADLGLLGLALLDCGTAQRALARAGRGHVHRAWSWACWALAGLLVPAGWLGAQLFSVQAQAGRVVAMDAMVAAVAGLMMLALVAGATAHGLALTKVDNRGEAYVADLRRTLSYWSSLSLRAMLVLGAVALVDTLGLLAYRGGAAWFGPWQGLAVALAPLSAWLIHKLPAWFGDGKGRFGVLLGRHVWTLALVVGVLLYGMVAVAVHVGVQWALFNGAPWQDAVGVPWRIAYAGGVLLALFVLTSLSTSFINLSSLHALYASRLTRAYIGSSNVNRLIFLRGRANGAGQHDIAQVNITETDRFDEIPVDVYQQTISAGPLHLINVTLNDTHGKEHSELLERDRKGVPLVFAPEGVFVEAKAQGVGQGWFYDWDALRRAGAESLSLGQLCAISGAAASTGMGGKTTLGGSLALSFANIRMGYWWDVGALLRRAARTGVRRAGVRGWAQLFGTYFYLWSEMTGDYARDQARVNLSDGGHFENSGAYELLRRRVRCIVVADNGEDPDYLFEDLDNLVRKARIDLGLSIVVALPEEVVALTGEAGRELFLNGTRQDWRARATAPGDPGFALLLEVYERGRSTPDGRDPDRLAGIMVWLKPRLSAGMPLDVAGYGGSHPSFPQETTGDQFFNEAQWESYRAMGYRMMDLLLSGEEHGDDLLRQINARAC